MCVNNCNAVLPYFSFSRNLTGLIVAECFNDAKGADFVDASHLWASRRSSKSGSSDDVCPSGRNTGAVAADFKARYLIGGGRFEFNVTNALNLPSSMAHPCTHEEVDRVEL